METHENGWEESSLLTVLPLIQHLILSSINRDKFPFTKTQLSIFALLSSRDSLTMKEVAGYISSSKEQATRAVAPLVDAGYVERFVDPANRTRIHVRLTAEGRAFMQSCWYEIHQNLTRTLQERYTPEEQARLKDSLNTIVTILSKA